MRVGYARVSTLDQDMASQLERLSDCDRVFSEKMSGGLKTRPQLAACLEFVREGDTLVATRLDRLGRSVEHLCAIWDGLQRKGVQLVILDQQIDTSTSTGKLLFHLLAAIAEFELSVRTEALHAGLAHARAMGKQMGRSPRLSEEAQAEARRQVDEGVRASIVARRFQISKETLYRYLRRSAGVASTPTNCS